MYGCGSATGKKWIEKGFRSVDDVKKAVSEGMKITDQQKMGKCFSYMYIIPMVTNYSLILTRNFIHNLQFHMWNCKIAMATASKWRPDLKTLARKKSMRLKLRSSNIVPRKTVVTPLIQHNNNNWPSSRTKCWSLWLRKRRRAATTQQHHSFIDSKEVQIREWPSRVSLQPLNI